MPTHLTLDQRRLGRQLRAAGIALEDLAREMGSTLSTVNRHCPPDYASRATMSGTPGKLEHDTGTYELPGQGPSRREEILDVASRLFAERGMRTSIDQIAEACGIRPGSLYHHFGSKEEICVELVARYRAQLDHLADRALTDPLCVSRPSLDRVTMLGTAMAECAIRSRAALLMTLYEPPAGASELADLASRVTTTVRGAMAHVLQMARSDGFLRGHVDVELLADRITESMLRTGLGVYYPTRSAYRVAPMKCQVILHGAARITIADEVLDNSPARHAADAAVAGWTTDEGHETAKRIRTAARSVFARSGYELTTVRDIASAAGLSPGGVYRHIDSKDQLFSSIMRSFADHLADGWNHVMSSPSTPLEKLDGLLWLLASSSDRFTPEYRMALVGVRYTPPTSRNLSRGYQTRLRQLKQLLAESVESNEVDMQGPSVDLWTRCIMALISSMPESAVQKAGVRGALQLGRDTVLRGVAVA